MTDVTDGKLSDITPDANNANLGTQRGLGMLESSLRKHGAGRSILLDRQGRVIAGNKTVEQAGQIGLDELIIVKTDGKQLVAVQREDLDLADDSTGARELAYADNRVGELDLAWNPETILADLDSGVDLSGLFREDELSEILGELGKTPKVDPGAQVDKAAELQEKWGILLGQIWELGEHRLACGDCTDRAVVEAVMRGERGNNIVTDPPFNVGFNYRTQNFNDNRDLEDYGVWLWGAIELAESYLNIPYRAFVWQAISTCRHWAQWIPRNFRLLANMKDFVQFRTTAIQYSWDPVLFWDEGDSQVKPVAGKRDYFLSQTSRFVLEESNGHPCPRPIDACEYIIKELCEPGNVIDFFLGSGTTLIACEQLGRKCRGIEIDPGYCAVTLERWHTMTGKDPVLTNA